jgi:uncharacterized DUF497 family protein
MADDAIDLQFIESAGFEWDEFKCVANLTKHGIDFDDASEVFDGPVLVWKSARREDERWIAIGIAFDQIISVIFTYRGEAIRIISARRPRENEKRAYRNAAARR